MSKKKTPPPADTPAGTTTQPAGHAPVHRHPAGARQRRSKGLQVPPRGQAASGRPVRKPPKGTPQVLRQGGLQMADMSEKLNVKPRTVTLDKEPKGFMDLLVLSMVAVLIEVLGTPEGAAMGKVLGLDPAALGDRRTRLLNFFAAYRRVHSIRVSAQQGQWLLDAARYLARTLIWNAGVSLLESGTLDETTATRLRQRMDDLSALQQRLQSGKTGGLRQTLRLKALSADKVKELDAQRLLFQTMVALREDQPVDWATFDQMAERYDRLVAEAGGDPLHGAGGLAPGADPRTAPR